MHDTRNRYGFRSFSDRPYDHSDGPSRKKHKSSIASDSLDKVRYLERALEDAEKRIKHLESGSGGESSRRVSELERKNRKLERALEDAEAWIKKLKRKSPGVSECETHIGKIDELTKTNKIMKGALEKSENRIRELEEQVNDSAEKMMDVYNSEDSSDKITLDEVGDAGGCDANTDLAIRKALEESEKKINDLKSRLHHREEEKDILKKTVDSLEGSLNDLMKNLEDKDEQIRVLKNELDIAKVTIKDKEAGAMALMNVRNLLEMENVEARAGFISQELTLLSNILRSIKNVSS